MENKYPIKSAVAEEDLPDGIVYVQQMDEIFKGAELDDASEYKLQRFMKIRSWLVTARNHRVRYYKDIDLLVHTFRNENRGYVLAAFQGNTVDTAYWLVKHTSQEREDVLKNILEHLRRRNENHNRN